MTGDDQDDTCMAREAVAGCASGCGDGAGAAGRGSRCGMPMRGLPAISRPGSGRVGAAGLNRASSPPMSWR